MKRVGRGVFAAAAAVLVMTMTGCGETMAEPTEDDVFERAEALYFEYRETTNEVLAAIHDGPWQVGTYGMTPSGAGCGDGWKFDLTRTTTIEPEAIPAARTEVARHLVDDGFEVEGMDLGSGAVSSGDVIVREQGVYSLLTVTFVDNGNVIVAATTPCNPGDKFVLADRLFGDGPLEPGYLPTQESPSDPLFFGITPGEPRFVGTPSS